MTTFLKFPDEQTAIDVLAQFRSTDEQGNPIWITGSHEHALDVVGIITKTLPDETVQTIPGFHINFIGSLPEAALPYEVFPVTPSRVFL